MASIYFEGQAANAEKYAKLIERILIQETSPTALILKKPIKKKVSKVKSKKKK
ncbi:MAG TPA: hypothetical protein VNJ08_11510 [Bacteriovoracaceae bacterium]|nr:hypothetical protein [Bacteriovoracaceae bacterium]